MLTAFPRNGIVAEVGTYQGRFARKILDVTIPRELHLVDRDWSNFEYANFVSEAENGQVRFHEGDSLECLLQFPDSHFDWIYLDAPRGHAKIKRNADAMTSKIKPDGLFVFRGYISFTRRGDEYGVVPVVNDLLCAGGWEMVALGLQRGGYHEVALRRMR